MNRKRLCKWVRNAVIALAASSAISPSLAATPQEVQAAIEKAQAYLLAHKNKSGNWEEVEKPNIAANPGITDLKGRQWGGLTSIATYALLASGRTRGRI